MNRFIPVLFASGAFALAACGGGGAGGPVPSGGTPSASPTQTQPPSNTTNASGVVVDDADGKPLAGVPVSLMPWAPCGPTPSPATAITPKSDGCPTPLPSPQPTTDANGNFRLSNVPNGQYILVIGSDVVYTPPPGYTPPSCTTNCGTPTPAPFTVQAVVHDNVTLTGGNQTLKAPTLPSNSYYAAPAWETNGDYRIATLDVGTEMPCYIAWEYLRAQNGLPGSSVDEWLTENVRADNYASQRSGTFTPVTDDIVNNRGGVSCQPSTLDQTIFAYNPTTNAHAIDPRSIWFSGQYLGYSPSIGSSAVGLAEFPIDPRANTDPVQPPWP